MGRTENIELSMIAVERTPLIRIAIKCGYASLVNSNFLYCIIDSFNFINFIFI